MSTQRIRGLVALVVLVAGVLWLPPLPSSLWLDETDTYVTIKDGVTAAIERTAHIHPQCSQLYNALMALWIQMAGSSEVALRLPSVLAMAAAAYLVFRLGCLLFDREAGVLAALVFVTSRDVLFAAADARPYAFATAASVAATIALVRLLSPRSLLGADGVTATADETHAGVIDGVRYAVTAALTVYLHQLFGLILLAHAIVVVVVLARGDARVQLATLAGTGILTMLLLGAEAPNLFATFAGRERLVYSPVPSPLFLVNLWASPLFVIAVAPVAFLLYAAGRRGSVTLPDAPAFTWLLLLTCTVLPPLALFTVSQLTDTRVFLPRYYLSCQPALTIVLGAVLRGFEPRAARIVAAASVAAVAVVVYARPYHTLEDWRGVITEVNAKIDDRTVVAVDAGFVEASDPAWLRLAPDDVRKAFLLAPLSYYPLRGRVELLPFRLEEHTRPYVETLARSLLSEEDHFVAVGRGRAPRWWSLWLDGRATAAGYVAVPLHASMHLEAVRYERRRDTSHAPAAMPTTNGSTK